MESNYEHLVKALRCKRDDCEGCDLSFFDNDEGWMCQYAAKDDDAAAAIEELQAKVTKWVSVEERKPPELTDVWCAVYTTDLIYVEDGETVEEAIENRQREAARNPRITLGNYSEDEGWTDGFFGIPMVCQPEYWLEMTIPKPPQEVQDWQ